MGGLRKYMPVTYATMMIGALASVGIPGLAGFFSKESIIEAVHLSTLPGSGFAYFCVLACVFVTAFYTFRLMFMTFHGQERFVDQSHGQDANGSHKAHDDHASPPHESPWVVTLPLVMLSIPSICAGWFIGPLLFGGYFGDSIQVTGDHDVLAQLGREFHGVVPMMLHALGTWPFWLSIAGIAAAALLYLKGVALPPWMTAGFSPVRTLLENKYYFDRFNDWFFAGGGRLLGRVLWKGGDVAIIDGFFVNGSARIVGWFSGVLRKLQSGLIYHYAFTMIIGLFVLLTLWFARN